MNLQTNLLLMFVMLIAGGMAATQSAVNARLSAFIGNPIQASFISFLIGAIALLLVLLIARQGLPPVSRVVAVPPYYLAGGLCGVVFITSAIFLVPRIGVVNVLFIGLAGQMIVSVMIDHFGWLGVERQPLHLYRVLGLALIVVGIVFLKREAPTGPQSWTKTTADVVRPQALLGSVSKWPENLLMELETDATAFALVDSDGDDGLVISLRESDYPPMHAWMSEGAKDSYYRLARLLDRYPSVEISVEGHSDATPITGNLQKLFPSNWELSAARAANVTNFLANQAHMSPQRLSVSGFANFQPIADNETEDGMSRNRRVALRLLNSIQ